MGKDCPQKGPVIGTVGCSTVRLMEGIGGKAIGRTDIRREQDSFGRDSHRIVPGDTPYFRLPIYNHFGAGPLHVIGAKGEWDMAGLIGEHGDHLVRSRANVVAEAGRGKAHHLKLLFRPAEDLFIYCDGKELIVYGEDRSVVEAELHRLMRRHDVRAGHGGGGSFKVLELFPRSIQTQDVPVPAAALMEPVELALHYGEDFPAWERWFVGRLGYSRNTISIFQGEPGTGKTSFLRHLIVRMRTTHRFYFVPPAEVGYLLRSGAMGFWIAEARLASNRSPVLIIEDAERVLMRRGSDNHEDISSILNLADGLMGHSLRAHIICTLNCAESDIDPALIRPGRLLAWRSFHRLTRQEAESLAQRKRLVVPEGDSCTLAELYHGTEAAHPARGPRVGFGAAIGTAPGRNGSRP